MSALPREPAADSTLAFLREGYGFVGERCRRLGSDAFRARLMLRPVVFMTGPEAVGLFYEGDRFTRVGAMPPSTLRLLQDQGSVQTLDGEAHRRRKRLFMGLMTPQRLDAFEAALQSAFEAAADDWRRRRQVVLLHDVRPLLMDALVRWTGIDLPARDRGARIGELAAMVETAGRLGPSMWRALVLRRRAERWAAGQIEAVRTGRLRPPVGTALRAVSEAVDDDGLPLDLAVAAVELLNVLRPTLAIDRFLVFAVLALHRNPQWRRLVAEDPAAAWRFIQEVRRLSPFFPVIGGRARAPVDWRGHRFETGDWAVLDLYGTNRDARSFDDPDRFDPERFAEGARPGPAIHRNVLVPQGGGFFETGHRCPGEWLTIRCLTTLVPLFAALDWRLPPQDLRVPPNRLPTAPASGLVLAFGG